MELSTILVLVVIFLANSVEQVIGFTGTALAMPITSLLIGVDLAKVVLNAPSIIGCGYLTITNLRYINRPVFVKMGGLMLVGMAGGVALSAHLSAQAALPACGIMVILIGANGLFNKKEWHFSKAGEVALLLVAGFLHGMFLSGGVLLVLYAVKKLEDKHEFRATLAALWFLLGVVLFGVDISQGLITVDSLGFIALAFIPLLAAMFVGRKLHESLPQALFLKASYVFLMLSGATLLL